MKKGLLIGLVFAMLLSTTGCGGSSAYDMAQQTQAVPQESVQKGTDKKHE